MYLIGEVDFPLEIKICVWHTEQNFRGINFMIQVELV